MQMSVPKGRYRTMGVTPQILSRPITDRLARYIQQKLTDRASKESWRAYLLRRIAEYLRQPAKLRPVGMSAWTVRDSKQPSPAVSAADAATAPNREYISAQYVDSDTILSLTCEQEYDLYWEFARNKELWDKYHKHGILQRDAVNVWLPEQYPVSSASKYAMAYIMSYHTAGVCNHAQLSIYTNTTSRTAFSQLCHAILIICL